MSVVQKMIKIVTVEQQQNLLHAESKILMPACPPGSLPAGINESEEMKL